MTTFTNSKLTDEYVSNATLIRLILWADQHNSHYVVAALRELQERRKADSVPVEINDDMAYAFHHALSDSSLGSYEIEEIKTGLRAAFANVTAHPAPVVPDEIALAIETLKQKLVECNRYNYCADAVKGVEDACRAAMLQSNQPVSQTYNLPELIEGMEVSIDVSTCDADLGNRYFGTVTEALELDTAKNGYILLVQDAEPNFDVNGNSPVIPDGWVMVPKQVTPEISNAINVVGQRCTCGNCSQRLWDLLLDATQQGVNRG